MSGNEVSRFSIWLSYHIAMESQQANPHTLFTVSPYASSTSAQPLSSYASSPT